MRQWCLPAVAPGAEPLLTDRLSPPLADERMEDCEMEPRYTIEQIDLLQRLRLSGMSKPQIVQALESLERLDSEHHRQPCYDPAATPNAAPAAAAPSSSSSSSSSLTSATTQTPNLDASLSPSNSYEASPPPLYPTTGAQRSFSYDLTEEDWDLEQKVEEYMRKDSNLVKEEIKSFLNSRRISQAIVGQVTGISQSYISQWLLQQGLEMSDSKRRAFYRWYLLERNTPGCRWNESQHAQVPRPRTEHPWCRQRELLTHLLPWYCAHPPQPGAAAAAVPARSCVKEEPDWKSGSGGGGVGGGPLRLRRGSRFTWRKECQSIMESFFIENQYPDEAKREEIANACNFAIQKPGCKLSEFERVTALKVYNWFANRRKEMKRRANIEAAILESHGIEVPSPSCQSTCEEAEVPEYTEQVSPGGLPSTAEYTEQVSPGGLPSTAEYTEQVSLGGLPSTAEYTEQVSLGGLPSTAEYTKAGESRGLPFNNRVTLFN
ncbi:homeobox-containing protein 1 isoform X3 [Brienomyrus brachyistius]|uniref:homeobox-containing protein 1 isoform X3 n=1 Tax=Brienomyrus brachyistius TaxID=42636 RepID=UPI0020B17C69|nr:homeobox-containing protein 1 isoform X3 [Brienomyrus brachyistius]